MGTGRKIRVAQTAGFCFGVNRAVNMVYDAVKENSKVVTFGPIIHNNTIIKDLESRGVQIVDDVSKITEDETVVLRAHGVPKTVSDELSERKINVKNAACPFVIKIHKIVGKIPAENSILLIAGDELHPEVTGIRSYAECQSFCFKNEEELKKLIEEHSEFVKSNIFVVSQTTFSIKEWQNCVNLLKLVYTNPNIFDTICSATEDRQNEAEKLSSESDLMIVIGSPESSNTMKLKNVCENNCKTYLIEDKKGLTNIDFTGYNNIGVTAGASAPACIIKEVLETMSEILNENANAEDSQEDVDFATALEESLSNMSTDQKVKGVIVGITPSEIEVDIGRKHAGYIPYNEYSFDPTVDPAKDCKVGDEVNVIIMKTNDAEGTVMLSKKRFDSAEAWTDIVKAQEEGTVVEGTVTEVVKGGLLVTTAKGIRVFVPASLSSLSRKDSLDDMLNQKVRFKVIEITERRKRAVGSIKDVLKEERKEAKEKFWETAQVGEHFTGVVKSLTSYGAFVDIGGIDGMIHISELSWKRIKNPSQVLNVGDTVEVYIKSLDDGKISLGYKKAEDNPWEILKTKYEVGSVIDTKIVGLTSFGAFANVIDGIDGLIHVSQITNHHIDNPSQELKVGDEVKAKITEIDYDKKRVSLSIKALLPEEPEEAADAEETKTEE